MFESVQLFGQKKSLILLMYFNRLQLYIWSTKSLELAGEFGKEPDDDFIAILQDYPDYPVILVTDFLEESFRHDTGVHATGTDRSALLERKLNYSFRNTPYRSATIVGRETEGRKDDKILLSALTKPELLEPWVRVLLDHKMQIQSVTSVAYLMQSYSQKAGLNDKHLMLVSIEEGSELRQTFMRGGKIQFSRLTSLTTKETASLPDAINHESLQIRQYLERIKLLPFDSQMVIKVFTPFKIDELSLEGYNNELNTFEVFNIHDMANAFSLTLDGLDKSPTTLFLGRILQRSRLANVYAPLNVLKYFKLNNLADALKSLGIGLVVATLLLKSFSAVDTVGNWELVDSLESQAAPLDQQYDLLTQRFPETPIPSAEMALVVETAEHISDNAYRLEDALALISEALAVAPELRLTRISWEMAAREPDANDPGVAQFGAPQLTLAPGQEVQSATLKDSTQINLVIEGLAYSPQSYTEAQNQVRFFLGALDSLPGITVTSSTMPTDVRVDTNVSTVVTNDALQSPFVLELTMDPI